MNAYEDPNQINARMIYLSREFTLVFHVNLDIVMN